MRRLRICLNLIILVAPIVFLGMGSIRLVRGIFNFLNTNRRLAGTMSAEATRAIGRVVRVGDVKITGNLWGIDAANRIDLLDVYVANGKSPSDGALAVAGRIAIWYNLRQVLASDRPHVPLIDELRIDSPQFLLQRGPTGHWNYQDLLPKSRTTTRAFTNKISLTNGTLLYSDKAFPHPEGVPLRPLDTRLTGLRGIVLVRQDKSLAFDVSGLAQAAYLRDFHVTGAVVPSPLRVQSRIVANQVSLSALADRLIPPSQLAVSQGRANVDIGILYTPPVGTSQQRLDTKALIGHGTLQLFDTSATGRMVYAPVQHLNGLATFTTDTILASLTGTYAGMPVKLDGAVLGLALPPQEQGQHSVRPAAPPTISLHGSVLGIDWQRARSLAFVPPLLKRLPQSVRHDLAKSVIIGDIRFDVAGPADNPEASLDAAIGHIKYSGYTADNADLRFAYVNRTLRASVKGRYAGGTAILRGTTSLDAVGAFEAQAQGRELNLAHLGIPEGTKLSGRGQLDISIRGRKNRTPSITARAEADRISVNGQQLRHVYAQADTAGSDLVIRTLTADDPKGFISVTGTVGLKSKRLDLTVDADELNFGSIAKAVFPEDAKPAKKPMAANPAANRAIKRLAEVEGYGYARTKLTGTIENPKMTGQIYAFGVQMGPVELDKITLSEFALSRDELRVNGVASRYPGQVLLSGAILQPFAQMPELALDTRVEDLDLTALTQLAGLERKDLVLTGSLSTDNIPIRGTISSPQTPDFFTATLQNATVNGIPIRNAAVTLRYQAEGVYVRNAAASVADGLVVAAGWVPFDGPMNLTVHGGGLALQALEEAALVSEKSDQVPIIVTGDANFDALITGTLKQPVVTAQSISTGPLVYNGFKIGSIQAFGRYSDNRVRIDNLVLTGPDLPLSDRLGAVQAAAERAADEKAAAQRFAGILPGAAPTVPVVKDGVITVKGLTYDLDSKKIHTDPIGPIVLENIRLERVRDLAYILVESGHDDIRKLLDDLRTVTGPVSGTVALGGTLDEPQADLTWSAKQLHAKGYEITSVTGSAYVDKNKVVYPSPATPGIKLKIDSPNVDLQSPADSRIRNVTVEFDRDGRRGHIFTTKNADVVDTEPVPADISVNNINLQFLQQVLDPGIVSRIDGLGDVGITARGLTTTPSIEFSANFRKIAIHSALDTKAPITIDHLDLIQGSVEEGLVKIGSLRAIKTDPQTGMPYEATITADLKGFTYQSPFLPDDAKLSVKGGVSVAFLASAVPTLLRHTSRGDITVSADVISLREKQSVSGEINLNIPRLESHSAATGIQDLIARLTFANDRVTVADFTAHTYIFGRPKDADDELPVAARNGSVAASAAAVKPPPARKTSPKAKIVEIAENDPKRRGSEIRLTGSLPLGFRNNAATGANDGIFVRIFDRNEVPAVVATAPVKGKPTRNANSRKVAFTFNEDPLPGSKNGLVRGTIRTDTDRPLRILGTAKDPVLSGRLTLYNALVTPPAEQKPGTFTIPILPSFDLAFRLGPDVRIRTPQLDALVATRQDIQAHGRLLQANTDLSLDGTILITEGKLKLPTATFNVLPGASIHVNYPTKEAGADVLGMNIELKARGSVVARSQSGVRKKYQVTVSARGPLTGDNIDPITGRSNLALSFETSPNDLASTQQLLTERLAGAIIGVDSLDQAGRNPGQAFANVLSGVLTGSVLPGIFDKTAASLGFEELAIGYDPIDRLTLNISRHLFGPLYVSYYRTLNATQERYDLKLSFRFKDRYQISFDLDEQHTQKLLLEGVWKF